MSIRSLLTKSFALLFVAATLTACDEPCDEVTDKCVECAGDVEEAVSFCELAGEELTDQDACQLTLDRIEELKSEASCS